MMKKVVFICLLSLSTCLSRPDGIKATIPEPISSTTTNAKDQPQPQTPAKEAAAVTPHLEIPPANTVPPQTASTTQSQPTSITTVATSPSVPATNKTDADTNKTTDKKEPPKKEEATPESKPAPKSETVTPSLDKKENETVPADKSKKNETVTVKPDVTPKPTEAPKSSDIPLQQARGFDGPSFMGGIILTLGLLAIGFMGFKYYKNQTERNYHTL